MYEDLQADHGKYEDYDDEMKQLRIDNKNHVLLIKLLKAKNTKLIEANDHELIHELTREIDDIKSLIATLRKSKE